MSTAPEQAKAEQAKAASFILVQAKTDRFRRAGREFTRAGVKIDVATLQPGELAALRAEPMLAISEVAEAAADPAKAKK